MTTELELQQFGGGAKVYAIPRQISLDSNFLNLVTQTQRIPWTDGGFDAYGNSPLSSEVGSIKATFLLDTEGDTRTISTLKRLAAQFANWGRRPLWATAEEYPVRWCPVKMDNIQMPINVRDMPKKRQRVQAVWQASYPRWSSRPHLNYLGDSTFDGSVALVDQATEYLDYDAQMNVGGFISLPRCLAYVKDGTRIDLLNYGDAPAPAKLTIMASRPWYLSEGLKFGDPGVMIGAYGSTSIFKPSVKRLNDYGGVAEQWRWDDTLGLNETLTVDTQDASVRLQHYPNNSESGYDDFVPVAGSGFITMQPGVNRLVVEGTFSGPFGFLKVDFEDTWY